MPQIESGSLLAWAIIPYAARHDLTPMVGAIFLAAVFAKVISHGE